MIHDHAQESNTVYEALEIEKQTLLPARPAGHQERISLRHDFHLEGSGNPEIPWKQSLVYPCFFWDLMVIQGDLNGFDCDLMGLNWDLMVFHRI